MLKEIILDKEVFTLDVKKSSFSLKEENNNRDTLIIELGEETIAHLKEIIEKINKASILEYKVNVPSEVTFTVEGPRATFYLIESQRQEDILSSRDSGIDLTITGKKFIYE